jgi:hypothetical protein
VGPSEVVREENHQDVVLQTSFFSLIKQCNSSFHIMGIHPQKYLNREICNNCIFMYKNRIIKPIKVILKWKTSKSNRGVNLIKVHYMHAWKYHNETLVQLVYTIKKKFVTKIFIKTQYGKN